MDGINEAEFAELYQDSHDRRDLMDKYMQLYLNKLGNTDARWFDKTPQHVYGLFLIKKVYPEAKFLHIYRNPLNVAASLLKGQVMPKHSLIGAVNYWNESMVLMEAFKSVYPDDVLDIKYEDFCSNPEVELEHIMCFVNESSTGANFKLKDIHPEKNKYTKTMDDEQVAYVQERCSEFMKKYGYAT